MTRESEGLFNNEKDSQAKLKELLICTLHQRSEPQERQTSDVLF